MLFRSTKYQTIALVITGAGLTASTKAFTTDRNYKKVCGIQARTNDLTAMSGLTFDKFEINGQEIYPADFDTQLVSSGTDLNPNERYDKDVDEPAEGSTVNITIKDGSIAAQAYPYTVKIILKLSNPLK